ncbi:MAG: hypothetical protein HYZ13_08045 [Acidobacteria bacterium]|nr:hypothetical protein [Acidobacteriota bacterium]
MRYRVAIFLGAFLLFALQPLIGRAILPLFGGGAGVWLACMLFFQLTLLAGYGYAHGLMANKTPSQGVKIHAVLVALALLALAIPLVQGRAPWLPSPLSSGAGNLFPPLAIVLLLAMLAGFPLLALSATSPLVQSLYARTTDAEPYRLYADSNWGSLMGLLAYPFLLEPFIGLSRQAYLLALVFVGHAALMLYLFLEGRSGDAPRQEVEPPESVEALSEGRWYKWMGLSALGTIWLMAVSNQVSTDVASVPLMWVLPLGIYLATFILAFEGRWPVTGRAWQLSMGGVLLVFAVLMSTGTVLPSVGALLKPIFPGAPQGMAHLHSAMEPRPILKTALLLLTLFAGGILAHGRLAQLRPEPRRLTSFYFFLSLGGCLGGAAVSIGAPLLFRQNYELPLVTLAAFLVLATSFRQRAGHPRRTASLAMAALGAGLVIVRLSTMALDRPDFFARDFFGSVELRQPHPAILSMVHGRTTHGLQFVKTPLRPAAYYGEGSATGRVLRFLQKDRPAIRVGVVGLGVGNIAAYGRPGDAFVFFEISPKIVDLSGPKGSAFTILRSTPAKVEVIQGDGRITLNEYRGEPFDLILIDAFAGGHIPAHLLTVEAIGGYLRPLKADGYLLLHVSHHLPLPQQAGANIRASGLFGSLLVSDSVLGQSKDGRQLFVEFNTQTWVVARKGEQLLTSALLGGSLALVVPPNTGSSYSAEVNHLIEAGNTFTHGLSPWTDERNSLTTLLF